MRSQREILYAVNSVEFFQQLLIYSVQSLRYFDPDILVRICIFGGATKTLKDAFKARDNVSIHHFAEADLRFGPALKWAALGQVRSERVLFVDADTLFLVPPSKIFEKHTRADFYGDRERATNGPWLRDGRVIRKRINESILNGLTKRFRSKRTFVPFTGLMLFNHGFQRKLDLALFFDLYEGFLSGRIPYPSTNAYMADEVAASLVLGRTRRAKLRHFNDNLITHYNDWNGCPSDLGGIFHTGSGLAPVAYELLGHHPESRLLHRLFRRLKRERSVQRWK